MNYRKLEKACDMMLSRDIKLYKYSRIPNSDYNEEGELKEDNDVRINYDGKVVRAFIDGIFVFGVHNGLILSYPTWFKKDKGMKRYVLSEFSEINKAYDLQVQKDNEHLRSKYKFPDVLPPLDK